MDGLHMLGADEIGEGYADLIGPIFQAAGGIVQSGVNYHEQDQAKKKLAADDEAKVKAAMAADINAVTAAAKADVSAQLKSPSAAVDAGAAAAAVAAQTRAGSVLSPAAAEQRARAAEAALAAATAKAQASPKDGYLLAVMKAWTATVNKAQNSQITSTALVPTTGAASGYDTGESWFMRPVLGPVPGWGVALGGAGTLGVVALAVKKWFLH